MALRAEGPGGMREENDEISELEATSGEMLETMVSILVSSEED